MNHGKNPGLIWGIVNIVLGILIIVFTFIALSGLYDRKGIFIVVYVMGGFLNLLTGIRQIKNGNGIAGILFTVLCLILFMIAFGTFLSS